ncbi:MAG: ribonuclease D [Anaerolineae bacterium]|nr:ribonuclease D [Anaerolineae bacterium]
MRRHTATQNPPLLVNTPEALDEMRYRLQAAPAIAVDTESNSLYAYSERVCLIQFSVPGEDYLVDPLALDGLACLASVFAASEVQKVFHAAEYDVMVLRRDYGYRFSNLFDTMIASRIVGWPRFGLASLLEEQFGVQTDKRMQRTNWGRRPLTEEQIEYARLDTHFLLALRDKLAAELQAQGREREARAAFARVARSRWTERTFDPHGFWRIKGARDLDDQGLAVLRELYIYREERAQELDRPPFKVFNDSVLVALSQQTPRSFAELGRVSGVPRRLPSRLRRKLLDVIEQGLGAPAPHRPPYQGPERPDDEVLARYEALRDWRRERAEQRGVELDVILSNRALHALAEENPTSPDALAQVGELNGWEREEYGREITGLLRRHGRIRAH